ncbi:DUF1285 domain-containing protein [Aliiglaciecola sp. CAU 1673]|uniref:DUF1285 domain-containing protein n=1 Tax=Aliiglaciecola sp. CAU 1673 TaxID=3032595 RepID=UPI0023DC0399|nr:DUF1285 domain-containing protein [Aliiglaciecola sp. CAU 1673]MDF2179685.1 DUF1285 domain-containing protein [Aliiglaciecola sp. CAU 1673]
MDLERLQRQLAASDAKLPPVHLWHPPYCGQLDLCIKHDGSWHYQGTPIGRLALVKLFASVLWKEDEDYFLVTPAEKVGIQVEDVPFVITQWQEEQSNLLFTTSLGDSFLVGNEHPVVLMRDKISGAELPYAKVRRNLYGRLHQNIYYQLVEKGRAKTYQGAPHLIVSSGPYQFSLGRL